MTKTVTDLLIAPFQRTDEEYEAIVRIGAALWPDEAQSVSEFRYGEEHRDPKWTRARYIGRLGGRIVAVGTYGDVEWCHKPGKYFVEVSVDPAFQRRGIGSRMYEFLLEEMDGLAPRQLVTWTREDRPEYVRFITKRGYELAMRYAVSRLRVDAFDVDRWRPAVDRVREQGIAIRSLAELEELDPDWKRSYYDVQWELFQDVPFRDPPTRRSFEEFCTRFESPGFSMDAHWFALDGSEYVGSTGLWFSESDPGKLYTGLTGVVRSHRRRGIATALKVTAAEYALDRGVAVIETDNEENNPMYELNLALGFEPAPAWSEFSIELRAQEA